MIITTYLCYKYHLGPFGAGLLRISVDILFCVGAGVAFATVMIFLRGIGVALATPFGLSSLVGTFLYASIVVIFLIKIH